MEIVIVLVRVLCYKQQISGEFKLKGRYLRKVIDVPVSLELVNMGLTEKSFSIRWHIKTRTTNVIVSSMFYYHCCELYPNFFLPIALS